VSAVALACLAGAVACLAVGLVALWALRRRLELVARAEHELRGPATALGLACQRMRRDSAAAARHAVVVEAQLARLRAGLEDLAAARRGQRGPGGPVSPVELGPFVRTALDPWRATLRRCSFDWRAGAATALADRGRLAQAIGNVLANSAEHGAGELDVRARRVPGGIRLEFRNGNRQLGQAAERVAGQLGGDEPGAREPGSGEPGSGEPGAGQPGSGEPGAREPGSAERCAREPGAVGAGRADRGKGIAIASQAARDLGGRLVVDVQPARTLAVLELPEEPASNPSPGRAGPDLAA
jgi:hypothetical protein